MAKTAYTKITKEAMLGAIGSMHGAVVQLHLADNYALAKKQQELIAEAEAWVEEWLKDI